MDYDDIKDSIKEISSTQTLVDIFVIAHNKVGGISDTIYDYEQGSDKYQHTLKTIEQWEEIEQELEMRVFRCAENERLLDERKPDSGTMKQIERFMEKYGYRDANGWWIKDNQ